MRWQSLEAANITLTCITHELSQRMIGSDGLHPTPPRPSLAVQNQGSWASKHQRETAYAGWSYETCRSPLPAQL